MFEATKNTRPGYPLAESRNSLQKCVREAGVDVFNLRFASSGDRGVSEGGGTGQPKPSVGAWRWCILAWSRFL